MISYEASKWYIKLWRKRWYLFAIFLLIKSTFEPTIMIELMLHYELEDESKDRINSNWKILKRHVELSKMCKYSSKEQRTD